MANITGKDYCKRLLAKSTDNDYWKIFLEKILTKNTGDNIDKDYWQILMLISTGKEYR